MALYDNPRSKYNPGIDAKGDFPDGIRHQNASLKGDPFAPLDHQRKWERCVVQEVYPDSHSCDVYTEKGKYLAGVSWPDGGRRAPKRGSRYVVHFGLGKPLLHESNHEVKRSPPDSEVPKVTPVKDVGGEDHFYAGKGSGNHRGDKPRDMLPGDWIESGSLGNLLGVLEGGTTILKASDLAQIIATQAHHMLRLIGKNIRMDTGGGTLDFQTEEGKSTLNLYMAADEETEGSPDVENFRIRCELGTDGELVDFRVTDPRGRSVYRVHVDPDGRVQKKSKRETHVINEDRRVEIGDADEKIVNGDETSQVGGSSERTVGGDSRQRVGGSHRVYAAQNTAFNALQDVILNAARNMSLSASGDMSGNAPALSMDVSNGDFVIDIGNPVKGDAQTSMSGFDVNTFTGNISFNSTLGSFNVNTRVPNSVNLGGPVPSALSAMIYEMFASFMELFGTLIDTHVHPLPQFNGAPTGPPLAPPWTGSRAMLPLAKSIYVSFGG